MDVNLYKTEELMVMGKVSVNHVTYKVGHYDELGIPKYARADFWKASIWKPHHYEADGDTPREAVIAVYKKAKLT